MQPKSKNGKFGPKRFNFVSAAAVYIGLCFETYCNIIFTPRRLLEKRQTMEYITDCNFFTATVRHFHICAPCVFEFAHFPDAGHWSQFAFQSPEIAAAGAVKIDLNFTKIGSDLNQPLKPSGSFLSKQLNIIGSTINNSCLLYSHLKSVIFWTNLF